MESHAHKESNHAESKISTPNVTQSSIIKIIVLVIFVLIVLTTFTILMTKKKKIDAPSTNALLDIPHTSFNISETYNLSETDYGAILSFKVNPGESIKVELTNDLCRTWTSEKIETYDDKNVKRIFEGFTNIQGPQCTPTQTIIFKNPGYSSITVKMGRCKSVDNCKFNF